MLVGYVSNERFVAVSDVLFEFRGLDGVVTARSSISGAVYADILPGKYTVVLGRDGYGSKIVAIEVQADKPYQFRLLSDCLLGYAWPKCVKSGERSEFRVHAIEEYELELWRYGGEKEFIRRLGTFDEHGPRATMQVSPDGDYTQTGIAWNKLGYHSAVLSQFVEAPERSGLYYFHARSKSGDFFTFPWVVAPSRPRAKSCGSRIGSYMECLQQLRWPLQLHQRRPLAAYADREFASRTQAVYRSGTSQL